MIIGEDPFRTDHLWQMMFRGYFYPAGREKLDALGALDLALWDIKGKALGVPVYDLLGGLSRDHVECYSTGFPRHGSLKETARACIEAGFRAFRYATADPPAGQPFNSHQMVRQDLRGLRGDSRGRGQGRRLGARLPHPPRFPRCRAAEHLDRAARALLRRGSGALRKSRRLSRTARST